jgi:hypothetical protein
MACASPVETEPVTADLAPAPLPARQVGQTFTYLQDEKEVVSTVVGVDGDQVSWRSSDGWQWTALTPFEGNSALSWKGPDGEGHQQYEGNPGAIFPLQIGKSVQVSYRAVHDGKGYGGLQICEVKDQKRVEVPAGAFDTYVVVCKSGGDLSKPYSTRTYYYAPAIGANVIEVTDEEGQGTRTSRLQHLPAPAA